MELTSLSVLRRYDVGVFVKICGVRTEEDIDVCAGSGADAVGLVFGPSVRQVTPDEARRLTRATLTRITAVGVFGGIPVGEIEQMASISGVQAVQLHGSYSAADFARLRALGLPLWRATSLRPDTDLRVGSFGEELLLLDAPVAGAGKTWDWSRIAGGRPDGRWILAGGLDPGNVQEAISETDPWGVDVSSGVEGRRGVKDHDLIRRFVHAAKFPPQERADG